MNGTRVCLFGKFRIQRDAHVSDALGARKIEELFCYLLLHRNHCHPRDILADLFWGENPTALAKKYLRKALWQLQTLLALPQVPPAGAILLVEPDWVQLNPTADLWLDIVAFEEAYACTQRVAIQELDCQQVQHLQEAIDLYRGELLEGWYHDWCLGERERFRYMYLAMLDKLMGCCELHHQYEAGINYGMRLLRCDPAHERTHRQLMRLYYLTGDRSEALRQYERCVSALQSELGVSPAHSTTAFYQQIRADQVEDLPKAPPTGTPLRLEAMTFTPEILDHLRQLEAKLVDIQQWVQQYIAVMERALSQSTLT
jgi:DNA-binding SARP family transcriptional activator